MTIEENVPNINGYTFRIVDDEWGYFFELGHNDCDKDIANSLGISLQLYRQKLISYGGEINFEIKDIRFETFELAISSFEWLDSILIMHMLIGDDNEINY